jgi:arylformamidase
MPPGDRGGVLYDITVPVDEHLPTWPGDPGFSRRLDAAIADGASANVSELRCGVHTGTHVDAPNHFIDGSGGIETIDLDALYGPALVADVGDADAIDEKVLAGIELDGVERILFRSRNGLLWGQDGFAAEFVAIAPGGAQVLVDRGVRLAGVDYLSVGDAQTHRILLGAGIVCVEGLDLRAVEPGRYDLACGPIKLVGSDGAPARVVLRG